MNYFIFISILKGGPSRYFASFSSTCKITFNVRETTKYYFGKIEKHQNGKNKQKRNKDGAGWRRLTRIANDELETFRITFSRCTNRDVATLSDSFHGN